MRRTLIIMFFNSVFLIFLLAFLISFSSPHKRRSCIILAMIGLGKNEIRTLIASLGEKAAMEEELSALLNEYLALQAEYGASLPAFESKKEFEDFFLSSFDGLSKPLIKACRQKLFPFVKEEDVSFVESDPYFDVLKNLSFKEKGLSLHMKEVLPGELFPYSSYEVGPAPLYGERPSFAYARKNFSYPVFEKDRRPWMSLVPHEIKTMEKAIEECEGEVLTYGLGMGYFAYRACLKEEVSHLTVIESDKDVISFFRNHLLPYFPKGKLVIKEGDALQEAKLGKKGSYDYLFCDIYHDAEDGLPLYIALKRDEGIAKRSAYWIEGDILVYLRRYLLAYLEEQIDPAIAKQGDKPYLEGGDFASRLFRSIHFYLKRREIKSEEDLSSLLSDDSLKEIIVGMDW